MNSARFPSGNRASRFAFFNSASPDCAARVSPIASAIATPRRRAFNTAACTGDISPSPVASTRSAIRTPPDRVVDRVTMPGTVERNLGRVPIPADRSACGTSTALPSRGA